MKLQASATADADAIKSFCKAELAGYKVPEHVVFTDEPLARNALKNSSKRPSRSVTLAEPDTHRLIFLFFSETRSATRRCTRWRPSLKPRTPISAPAMSIATKRPCGPATPLASSPRTSGARVLRVCHRLATGVDVAEQLGAEVHWCKGTTPLTPPLRSGERFSGTIQLCCFERREGLSDEALEHIWFQSMCRWLLIPRTPSVTDKIGCSARRTSRSTGLLRNTFRLRPQFTHRLFRRWR